MVTAGLLAGVLLELLNVGRMCDGVHGEVYCECAQSETKAGEDVARKEAVREDGVLAPCLALGPGVTVELRHLVDCDVVRKEAKRACDREKVSS